MDPESALNYLGSKFLFLAFLRRRSSSALESQSISQCGPQSIRITWGAYLKLWFFALKMDLLNQNLWELIPLTSPHEGCYVH